MSRDQLDQRIEYNDDFESSAPTTASGRFLVYEWDFYSRGDNWDFTLSIDPAICPGGLDLRGVAKEQIPAGVFFIQGTHAIATNGSFLSESDMQSLVRRCVSEVEQLIPPGGRF